MPSHVALGLWLAALISIGAAAAGALTLRAALASTVLGTVIFASGGIAWSIPLLAFFVTSSLLSRPARNTMPAAGRNSPRRAARQVLANGLVPALWALCHSVFSTHAWSLLFASALATAAADTWATELGRRSSSSPRDVLTGRRVATGTSGGITAMGLSASLAGSITVMAACLATGIIGTADAVAVTLAGFSGALVDSLLGAAFQERRWCSTCVVETEDVIHGRCSTPTSYVRGLRGFDNDWVNLSASACGSMLGLAWRYLV